VVTARELQALNGTRWLNDQVINFYLEMIQRRNVAQREATGGK
jgi:Ulp1 family protease